MILARLLEEGGRLNVQVAGTLMGMELDVMCGLLWGMMRGLRWVVSHYATLVHCGMDGPWERTGTRRTTNSGLLRALSSPSSSRTAAYVCGVPSRRSGEQDCKGACVRCHILPKLTLYSGYCSSCWTSLIAHVCASADLRITGTPDPPAPP